MGMITDRDFRNKVIPAALNPLRMPASAVMSHPLVTVRDDDYLFEALYQMSRHDIHRVAVVDAEGQLAGIITDTDLLRLQTSSPLYLIRDLEYAQDLETIKVIYGRVVQLIIGLSRSGIKTVDLVRLISHIHDSVVLRLIHVIRQGEFEDLTDRFAFVVLGSEGRMEQTLKTDQDNAIVYADDLSEEELEKLTRFSVLLIDSLIAIGVPPCPGGIMAKNEYWRQKASVWEQRIGEWTGSPIPDNILKFSMFSEIRLLYGDGELVERLRRYTHRHVRENAVFIAHMAKNVLRFPPPLGWFRRYQGGAHRRAPGAARHQEVGDFRLHRGNEAPRHQRWALRHGHLGPHPAPGRGGGTVPGRSGRIHLQLQLPRLPASPEPGAGHRGRARRNGLRGPQGVERDRAGKARNRLRGGQVVPEFLQLRFKLDFISS